MFTGRQNELGMLEKRYASKTGELIVIYGRRRIGKTSPTFSISAGKYPVWNSSNPFHQQLARMPLFRIGRLLFALV